MPLVTECPKCRTLFKVVRDQLKISDGWVRCGHCGEIFDTAINLREWEDKPATVQAVDRQISAEGGTQEPSHEAATASTDNLPAADDATVTVGLSPPATLEAATVSLADATVDLTNVADEQLADPAQRVDANEPVAADKNIADFAIGATEPVVSEATRPAIGRKRRGARMAKVPAQTPARSAPSEGHADVSFLRKKPRREKVPSGHRTAMWGIGVLVLSWFLAFQWLWQERDLLAAWSPRLRGVLEPVCAQIGCVVGPLRRIEYLSVESSSFNKAKGDGYLLSFAIRNQFDFDLERPAVELTLTDAADKPVYRKVIAARELKPDSPLMSAGEEWVVAVPVTVLASAGMTPAKDKARPTIVGYRLLAFYP